MFNPVVLLIAIILFITVILIIILILILGLFYPKQKPIPLSPALSPLSPALSPLSPSKKKCKVDTDCKDKKELCVRGTCTSCLDAVKQVKNIKLDPKIDSCTYTSNYYRFNNAIADPQSTFEKTSVDVGSQPSADNCESYCLQSGCPAWEFNKEGECFFYPNPHPVLKYNNDNRVIGLSRMVY